MNASVQEQVVLRRGAASNLPGGVPHQIHGDGSLLLSVFTSNHNPLYAKFNRATISRLAGADSAGNKFEMWELLMHMVG
jgi:hypothetical protein